MPDLKQPQINSLIISGRLTADPEVKEVVTRDLRKTVCNVSIATDIGWGDNKKSLFLDCTAWGKTAEMIGKLHTGSPVIFEGRIQMEEWDDKTSGVKRRKITMTVNRVHGLAWDNTEQAEKQTERTASGEEVPF